MLVRGPGLRRVPHTPVLHGPNRQRVQLGRRGGAQVQPGPERRAGPPRDPRAREERHLAPPAERSRVGAQAQRRDEGVPIEEGGFVMGKQSGVVREKLSDLDMNENRDWLSHPRNAQ